MSLHMTFLDYSASWRDLAVNFGPNWNKVKAKFHLLLGLVHSAWLPLYMHFRAFYLNKCSHTMPTSVDLDDAAPTVQQLLYTTVSYFRWLHSLLSSLFTSLPPPFYSFTFPSIVCTVNSWANLLFVLQAGWTVTRPPISTNIYSQTWPGCWPPSWHKTRKNTRL